LEARVIVPGGEGEPPDGRSGAAIDAVALDCRPRATRLQTSPIDGIEVLVGGRFDPASELRRRSFL